MTTFEGAKYSFNGKGCGYTAVSPVSGVDLNLSIKTGYITSTGISYKDETYLSLPMFVHLISDKGEVKISGGERSLGATVTFKAVGAQEFQKVNLQ